MLKHPKISAKTTITNAEGKAVQMNAVEVVVDKVFQLEGMLEISETMRNSAKQIEIPWIKDDHGEYVMLQGNRSYPFDSTSYVEVAEGECGILIGRSTFNRNGAWIVSGLYDSGFKNTVGAVIHTTNPIKLYRGTRIAQFLICDAETYSTYNGIYQGK